MGTVVENDVAKANKGKIFFEIPDDNHEIMTELVEAAPSGWSWVDGVLKPSEKLVASGNVQNNTGFDLNRWGDCKIVGKYKEEYKEGENRQECPNLHAIIVEQKLPGSIVFTETGYSDGMGLVSAKHLIVGLINKGYRGQLSFYKDCYDNKKFNNPARCAIVLKKWCGPLWYEENGPQPARIKLEWEGRYGGNEKDIYPVLTVCRSLNLKGYTPQPPTRQW